MMSELAFDASGDPFELPSTARGWRVRRMRARGSLEVVYGADGLPLVLPIGARLTDLRHAVRAPGRYRLDAVDGDARLVAVARPAYVQVAPPPGDELVVLASGTLVRIAAGADAIVVPLVVTRMVDGKHELVGLGGRATIDPSAVADADAALDPIVPPLDADTIAHFFAIQSMLAPDEATVSRAIAAELSPAELRAWFDELRALTVVEAVAKIRAIMRKPTVARGAG